MRKFCTQHALSRFFDCVWFSESGLADEDTWFFLSTHIDCCCRTWRKRKQLEISNRFHKRNDFVVKHGHYCIMLHWTQTDDDNERRCQHHSMWGCVLPGIEETFIIFENLNQLNPLIRDNWWQFGSNKWFETIAKHAWESVNNQLINWVNLILWLMLTNGNDKADVPVVQNRIVQLLRDMKWTPSPALHLQLMQYHRCPIDGLNALVCQIWWSQQTLM